MRKRGPKPNRGKLTSRASEVIADLKKPVPLTKLALRYGVTKQALHLFVKTRNIKRPSVPKPDHIRVCPLCRKISRAASKHGSEFLASPTLMKQVGLVSSRIRDRREFRDHLRRLKRAKIVNPLLARIMQKHYEAAFRDYFTLELPVTQIGRKHGIANLASVMQRYREKGFTFPPPLFKYDGNTRRARPREWTNKKERAKVK